MAEGAKRGGALTVALTNTARSPLAMSCDYAVDIAAGVEKSVAATKTFVNSAVAGLVLMAHATGDRALLDAVRALPGHFRTAIGCDWMALAPALENARSLFILGRGPAVAIAEEAALEIQGDLRHACRGLQRGRGHARPACSGDARLPRPGACRTRQVGAVDGRDRRSAARPRARRSLRPPTLSAPPAVCRLRQPATRSPTRSRWWCRSTCSSKPLPAIAVSNPDEPRNLKKVTETR